MRVAAIDCGTNSVRLLVADLDPSTGTALDVVRRMEIVRLGQDVDRTGRLAPAALERTFAALRSYRTMIVDLGAERVRMVATSATRDASNREAFSAGVTEILGVVPEVITGSEEAALSFDGATRELVASARGGPSAAPRDIASQGLASKVIVTGGVAAPYLVVDIGGGSTEFVLGETAVVASRSVDVGCVRITERHLHDDPPGDSQVAAARTDIGAALDVAGRDVPLREARTVIGVAGTVTTIAAIALGLQAYDAERIHLSRVSATDVRRISRDLRGMSREQRAALPVMHPGRVDVITAGALVLEAVVERTGAVEVVASEKDILDGLAWSCLPPRAPLRPQ